MAAQTMTPSSIKPFPWDEAIGFGLGDAAAVAAGVLVA